MSDADKKKKADESILEKLYKKMKYIEDDVRRLRKSSQDRQDGGASCSRAEASRTPLAVPVPQTPLWTPEFLLDSLSARECPNDESEYNCQEENFDTASDEVHETALNEEALLIMGDDPSAVISKEVMFHSTLATRWNAWIKAGIDKETRVSLLNGYSRTGNCRLDAPKLNPEFATTLNETAIKRDHHFMDSQCLIGSGLSALGSAITLLLNEPDEGVNRNELLKLLCDAGKLFTDLHHKESVARKAYILPGMDKRSKVILGKTEIDEFLFGENLSEKLKAAKALEKAGLELKLQSADQAAPRAPLKPHNTGNWKGPSVKFQGSNQAGNRQSYHRSRPSRGRHYSGNSQGNSQNQQQTEKKTYQKSTKEK